MDELEREENKSVYGENSEPEFVTVSMGVAYKIDDDPLYMVKIPVEDGDVQPSDAVMIDGSTMDDEFPDEHIPRTALNDGIEWFRSLNL